MGDLGQDILLAVPLLVLVLTGLALMAVEMLHANRLLAPLAALGLGASLALALPIEGLFTPSIGKAAFHSLLVFGGTAGLVHVLFCAIGLFSIAFIHRYNRLLDFPVNAVYSLVVFGIIGMIMLANANDFLLLFIGLETMSIVFYVMAGLVKRSPESNESGFKYFLLGAFASGFLLYGIALLYGLTGTTQLVGVAQAVFNPDATQSILNNPIFYPAMAMLLVGFLFKVAAFPFHNWTPDVYTGAPSPLAGFMGSGGKLAAFVAFSFVLMRTVPVYGMVEGAEPKILNVLVVLGLVSMIYGNIVALQQTNVKRILAFSSVAHSGYVLLAMACGPEGYLAALFYLVVYALMTLGAFGMITLFENAGLGARLSEWQGKGRELVLPAVVMSVVLFSLAGLPPLGGFMGKYMVFGTAIRTAVQANNNLLLIAAIAGIVTSVIGAFYYLRVIQVLFFQKPFSTRFGQENKVADHNLFSPSKIAVGAGLLIAALVILFGVYPSLLLEWLAVPYGADGHLTSYLSFLSR